MTVSNVILAKWFEIWRVMNWSQMQSSGFWISWKTKILVHHHRKCFVNNLVELETIWNALEGSDGHSPGSYKSCLVWKSSTQLMEPVETVANVVWVMYVVAWWRGVRGVRGGISRISREEEALTRRRARGSADYYCYYYYYYYCYYFDDYNDDYDYDYAYH